MTLKKFFTFTTLSLSMVIITICSGIFVIFQAKSESENTILETEWTLKEQIQAYLSQNEKDILIFNKSIQYNNINSCQNIFDTEKRQQCQDIITSTAAQNSLEVTKCDEIINAEKKEECKNLILEKRAIMSANKTFCAMIENTDIKKRCQENIDAKKLQNLIEKWNITEIACLELENNFQKECLKAITSEKIEEIFLTATRTNNTAHCNSIADEELKSLCRDKVIIARSENEWNPEICETINHQEKRLFCRNNAINSKNSKIFQNAIDNNLLEECKNITNSTLQNNCHDTIILSQIKTEKNISLCQMLKNPDNKQLCMNILNQ